MTGIGLLLLPIVVSTLAVFILSAIIHTALPWHRSDFATIPNEDGVLNALRPFALPPGDYMAPSPLTAGGMRSPEFMDKRNRGPVFLMTVMPNGAFSMGKYLGVWFVWVLIVAIVVGFITGHIVAPGGNRHVVFHHATVLTFLSYGMANVPASIWYHRKWSTTGKDLIDAAIYGVATGLVFMWMWPVAM
ncbi:MAG: hypothetical protein ACREL5_10870 [Gemmatimonadales bacterium]